MSKKAKRQKNNRPSNTKSSKPTNTKNTKNINTGKNIKQDKPVNTTTDKPINTHTTKPSKPTKTKKAKKENKPLTTKTKKRILIIAALFVLFAIAVSAIIWFSFRNNAIAVMVGSDQVGIMEQSNITSTEFSNLITAKMKEIVGNDLKLEDEISLVPIHSSKKNIQNTEVVLSDVCKVVNYQQTAVSINVNGKSYVIVANQEIADKVLADTLAAYDLPAGTSNPQFSDKVDTTEVFVENSSVSSENVALGKMTEKKEENRTHTVVEGESFGTISTDYGMTQNELLAINPDLTSEDLTTLKIGQTLNVTVEVPVVAIQSTQTVKTEEEIPYSSEVVENNNEQKTYRKVLREGVNGKKEVTEEVVYVNGIKTDTTVKNEKIITEAVNEKVEVGTLGEEARPASGSFIFPVSGVISSVFGDRDYGNGHHYGLDIAADGGNPVHAADSGVVTFAGWNSGGYGNLVIIDHGNGFVTYYAHNSELCVQKGDTVSQGTTIAKVGTTGDSTGNHCHFEVIRNGQKLDPLNFLSLN